MRKQPPKPAELTPKQDNERNLIRDIRTYRFLTYVMGGGVKVHNDELKRHHKERDERTPIRVASIRGQLRFWWRACNPSKCKTIEELHAREAEIWGSAETPSSVKITVKQQPDRPRNHIVYEYTSRKNENTGIVTSRVRPLRDRQDVAYGAFPIQPSNKAQNATPREEPGVLADYAMQEFKVEFIYDNLHAADVEVALWAWESFGGIGARTRRGFGAIERSDLQPSLEDIRRRLRDFADRPVVAGVPSLANARFESAGTREVKSVVAWESGLNVLRRLRQGANLGRNPPQPQSQSPAGRSRWPEPERIRELTKQRLRKHQPLPNPVDCFPRGAFGMPIVFHFQDGASSSDERGKDPADTELKPAMADRMASPLIVRPIRDGNEFRACALVLNTAVPEDIVLKTKSGLHPVSITLKRTENAAHIEPMKNNGQVCLDPLDRFLQELKK